MITENRVCNSIYILYRKYLWEDLSINDFELESTSFRQSLMDIRSVLVGTSSRYSYLGFTQEDQAGAGVDRKSVV